MRAWLEPHGAGLRSSDVPPPTPSVIIARPKMAVDESRGARQETSAQHETVRHHRSDGGRLLQQYRDCDTQEAWKQSDTPEAWKQIDTQDAWKQRAHWAWTSACHVGA